MTSSPNTMKPREYFVKIFPEGYGGAVTISTTEQGENPPESERIKVIELTPQVSNALKQAELFEELLQAFDFVLSNYGVPSIVYDSGKNRNFEKLIQQCKEASK